MGNISPDWPPGAYARLKAAEWPVWLRGDYQRPDPTTGYVPMAELMCGQCDRPIFFQANGSVPKLTTNLTEIRNMVAFHIQQGCPGEQ